MAKKIKEFNMLTFTKKWVTRLMWFFVIDLQIPFILAVIYQDAEILSSLAPIICSLIADIGVIMIGYFFKSFFETSEQEKNKLIQQQLDGGLEYIDINEGSERG